MDDYSPDPGPTAAAPTRRKPRIALMGEFSAGKSTLSNIMIGRGIIPTKVTATALPPVWMAYGDEAPWREDLQGNRHPVDIDRLEDVPLDDTAFIRLFLKAEVLEVCDLIDTPGISDPNMPPEVWERAADEADGVIWLTHATQAWRQSEAAVWTALPEELWSRSLLLLTRIDKLLTQSDRDRVHHRVRQETEGLFREVLPISLSEALAAGDDAEKWERAGGDAFSDALLALISEIERRIRMDADARTPRGQAPGRTLPTSAPKPEDRPRLRVVAEAGKATPQRVRPGTSGPAMPQRPVPRRVAPSEGGPVRPARPPR